MMEHPKNQKDYNKYDDQIENVDEILGTDVKINPDYYIHSALLKAQQALITEDVQSGFLQFRMLVEHIEVLCKAAKMLSGDYEETLKKFKETTEYMEEKKDYIKVARLANKKIELLMTEVFSSKISTDPLKA